MSKIKDTFEIIKDANEQINSVLRVTSGEPGLGKVTFVVAKTAILAIVGTILLMIIPFSLLITGVEAIETKLRAKLKGTA